MVRSARHSDRRLCSPKRGSTTLCPTLEWALRGDQCRTDNMQRMKRHTRKRSDKTMRMRVTKNSLTLIEGLSMEIYIYIKVHLYRSTPIYILGTPHIVVPVYRGIHIYTYIYKRYNYAGRQAPSFWRHVFQKLS